MDSLSNINELDEKGYETKASTKDLAGKFIRCKLLRVMIWEHLQGW